jgi:hypothetical protein
MAATGLGDRHLSPSAGQIGIPLQHQAGIAERGFFTGEADGQAVCRSGRDSDQRAAIARQRIAAEDPLQTIRNAITVRIRVELDFLAGRAVESLRDRPGR